MQVEQGEEWSVRHRARVPDEADQNSRRGTKRLYFCMAFRCAPLALFLAALTLFRALHLSQGRPGLPFGSF